MDAQQWGQVIAQVPVGEPVGLEPGDGDGGQQRVDAWVTEAQGGDALPVDGCRCGDAVEDFLADHRVVVDAFGAEESPVGAEADLPQGGQVAQPLPDPKVAAVVDGGLGPDGPAFLVVLLDACRLVLDMQRGSDSLREHPGAEPGRCGMAAASDQPTIEDERHPVGSANVDVLSHHLFEERPARQGRSSIWVRENSTCSIEMS